MLTKSTISKLHLIEGEFSAGDAKDVLTNVFSSKIKFHELKNFSSQIQNGKNDDFAKERILFLTNELNKINEIIAEARLLNKKIKISSEIKISLCDE